MIINEFRKNYFRGIEVPIKKKDQRKHGFKKWSLSLSGSGSSLFHLHGAVRMVYISL